LVLKDSHQIEGMDIPEATKEADAKMRKLSKPKLQSLSNVNKPGSLASRNHSVSIPYSGLPINQYCIKASYNSAVSGDYVSEEMLGKVLAQGCRFIDFEVFYDSKRDAAFVSYSTDPTYTVIKTKNKVVLDTLLQRIAKDAFTKPPNLHDPLFLHLRIKSKDDRVYKAVAKAVKFALNTKLYPHKIEDTTTMRDVNEKVILIIDKLQNLDWKSGASCNSKKSKDNSKNSKEGFVETYIEPLTVQERKKLEEKIKQRGANKREEEQKKKEEEQKKKNQQSPVLGTKTTTLAPSKKKTTTTTTTTKTPLSKKTTLAPLPPQKQAIINKVANEPTCVDLSTLFHLESGSDTVIREYYTALSQHCKSPPRLMKGNKKTDVKVLRIVEPDITVTDIKKPDVPGVLVPVRNPELAETKNFVMNYGAQIVTYNYYIEDKSLQAYEDIFNTFGFAILPISSVMDHFTPMKRYPQ